MKIDAHQHFWTLARTDYGWLTPAVGSIYRDFLPGDITPLLRNAGIEGTVLVQAAPTVAETEYMLKLADENSFIKGVVGWVDFESADVGSEIARLCRHPALVGLRPMIQDLPDDDWMLRPGLGAAFKALIAHGLAFDALTFPRHLKNLLRLLSRYPEMRAVIDHASKPQIRDGDFAEWAADMAVLAKETKVYCKMSGLVTEAGSGWSVEKLKPYVEHLLAAFGPERLVWGSDWPVCTLTASYDAWGEATDALLSGLSRDEKMAVLGGTAAKVYRLRM